MCTTADVNVRMYGCVCETSSAVCDCVCMAAGVGGRAHVGANIAMEEENRRRRVAESAA